jgi:FkbM family methyltransferase
MFTEHVFSLPWNSWYRFAYVPEYRDLFFEYIVTFLFQYPIRRGDVVVHVGASVGEETLRFAKSIGRTGRLIAVEPEAKNIERLFRIFRPDSFPQVAVVGKAASNVTGDLRFFVGGEKEHRIAEIPGNELTYEWWGVTDHLNESRYKGVTNVPADTLDNIVRPYSLDHVDFILIETNGSELEVVKGMEEILRITKRLGVRGHVMRDGIPINSSIARLLQERGFETAISSEGMVLAERRR